MKLVGIVKAVIVLELGCATLVLSAWAKSPLQKYVEKIKGRDFEYIEAHAPAELLGKEERKTRDIIDSCVTGVTQKTTPEIDHVQIIAWGQGDLSAMLLHNPLQGGTSWYLSSEVRISSLAVVSIESITSVTSGFHRDNFKMVDKVLVAGDLYAQVISTRSAFTEVEIRPYLKTGVRYDKGRNALVWGNGMAIGYSWRRVSFKDQSKPNVSVWKNEPSQNFDSYILLEETHPPRSARLLINPMFDPAKGIEVALSRLRAQRAVEVALEVGKPTGGGGTFGTAQVGVPAPTAALTLLSATPEQIKLKVDGQKIMLKEADGAFMHLPSGTLYMLKPRDPAEKTPTLEKIPHAFKVKNLDVLASRSPIQKISAKALAQWDEYTAAVLPPEDSGINFDMIPCELRQGRRKVLGLSDGLFEFTTTGIEPDRVTFNLRRVVIK